MTVAQPLISNLTTPEARPAWQTQASLRPATDIQPQVGVYYDAAGLPHQAYVTADGSASNAAVVVPSDTVALATPARALWVGGAGNVTALMAGGQTVTFTAVPAGTLLPIQAVRVNATATTATLIVAFW